MSCIVPASQKYFQDWGGLQRTGGDKSRLGCGVSGGASASEPPYHGFQPHEPDREILPFSGEAPLDVG